MLRHNYVAAEGPAWTVTRQFCNSIGLKRYLWSKPKEGRPTKGQWTFFLKQCNNSYIPNRAQFAQTFSACRSIPHFFGGGIFLQHAAGEWEHLFGCVPLRGICHLEWFHFFKFDSINFTNANAAQPNCWFIPIQALGHYWHILIRHYSRSSCWGNIIIGSWCEGLCANS